MGCRGDDVGVGERGLCDASCDEAGNVRHVGEEVGAVFCADGFHTCVVDNAGVC